MQALPFRVQGRDFLHWVRASSLRSKGGLKGGLKGSLKEALKGDLRRGLKTESFQARGFQVRRLQC